MTQDAIYRPFYNSPPGKEFKGFFFCFFFPKEKMGGFEKIEK